MSRISYRGRDGCPLHAAIVGDGEGPPLVLMHAGGPDHESLLPLAAHLADRHTVVLPDLRGYGRSVCPNPTLHTWDQYTDDVVRLLGHLGVSGAAIGGAGLGATITLRVAAAYPSLVRAAVLIALEDIEDDAAKEAEIRFMDDFAARVAAEGIEAGWEPILADFPPVVGAMVRDAIPRSDPASIVAAAAIGRDRSFREVAELVAITAPTLVFPGDDARHPTALAEQVARILPHGRLAPATTWGDLHTADDLARVIAPAIREFLDKIT